MKIAMFRYAPNAGDGIFPCDDDALVYGGTIRISEVVDVTFPPLPVAQTTAAEVSVIDKAIADVTQEFAQKLDALKTRKQELMAISHDGAAFAWAALLPLGALLIAAGHVAQVMA